MIITDGNVDLTDVPIICWTNVVTVNNVTTDYSSDPDFPITNVANPSLALKWKMDTTDSPLGTSARIDINTAGLGLINYVAIAGHNFGDASVTVSLLVSSSSASPAHQELITGQQVTGNAPIIFLFEADEMDEVAILLSNPSSAAEIAVIYAGQYMQMEEGIQADHSPLPLASSSDTVSGKSENSTFLGRIVLGSQAGSAASFANMSKDWVRSDLVPFLANAEEFPFFYGWSPLTYPDETAFAWLDNNPVPVFDIDGYGSIELSMRGIVS